MDDFPSFHEYNESGSFDQDKAQNYESMAALRTNVNHMVAY